MKYEHQTTDKELGEKRKTLRRESDQTKWGKLFIVAIGSFALGAVTEKALDQYFKCKDMSGVTVCR